MSQYEPISGDDDVESGKRKPNNKANESAEAFQSTYQSESPSPQQQSQQPNASSSQSSQSQSQSQSQTSQQSVPQTSYTLPLYAPAPGSVAAIPVAIPVGQDTQRYYGQWYDAWFNCFSDCEVCLIGYFISPLLYAKNAERLGLSEFQQALLTFGIPWICLIIFASLVNISEVFLVFLFVARIILLILGAQMRKKIRNKFTIAGSECEDYMCHFFCFCCALTQETRHVKRAQGLLL